MQKTKRTLWHVVALGCCAVLCALCVGCSSGNSQSNSSASTEVETGDPVAIEGMDFDFTNRDSKTEYDDSAATHIEFSGTSAQVSGSGATFADNTLTITDEGTYVVSGELSQGQLVVNSTSETKIQVVFAGVTIHNDNGPAVYIKQADKVFITLKDGTTNKLTDGTSYVLDEGSDEPYACLFSKDDLTINGSGSLEVQGNYCHAVCSKDDLVITGGTYSITSKEDALRGRDCVKIKDGDFTITSGEDAVKSNNDEEETKGYVYIAGGTYSINAGDDAFHGETVLEICGGTIDVTSCYEGFEAERVYITGGRSSLIASDDGINAASGSTFASAGSVDPATMGGMGAGAQQGTTDPGAQAATGQGGTLAGDPRANEAQANNGAADNAIAEGGAGMNDANCLIQISGGYTFVDAQGDGVDSNGSIEITGGVLLVCGPSSENDASFDYDLTSTISGGTVLMLGSKNMAQNFTSGTQPFFLQNLSGKAGANVAVCDSNGTVLMSVTATRTFSVVQGSCSSFTEGGSYKVVVGGSVSSADTHGYTTGGSVSGGQSTSVTASTTASGGFGGLGANGSPMDAGRGGTAQVQPRDSMPQAGGGAQQGGTQQGGTQQGSSGQQSTRK